ncbi:cobalamin-independent methionine synthase [Phaffia rhodozyma]|uniref:5-methyltetrahydropteroyltriglutamate--homocysteine S-methyltransferase n=1 Tax=Phaffia rhodozyma TaxID=264483 RepID=A0A0F7SQW7_PHARH|nr:cobalamin-independent methionine synthase [Phaffia rhodozyma]
MVASAVLGFPRIGPNREIKKAVEAYWAGKTSAEDLQATAKTVRQQRWQTQKERGADFIASNDFAFYDHVLDHCVSFNLIPERYTKHGLSPLDIAFAMGRGRQVPEQGIDLSAMEMKKWFDSNYHWIVPEVSGSTEFKLNNVKAVDEFKEAKALGITTRPVLLGPITLLAFSKPAADAAPGYEPLQSLDKLVPLYADLLAQLKEAGAEWVQIDEPILVLDRAESLGAEFASTYAELSKVAPKIVLTTYFGRLGKSLDFVKDLPVDAIHVDLSERGDASQLDATIAAIKDKKTVLSLGLISGRNVWKADLAAAAETAQKAIAALGADRVIVATSSSLLHTPVTLASEDRLTAQQLDWLSFALEKVAEVATLAHAVSGSADEAQKAALEANKASIKARRDFETNSDAAVRERVAAIKPSDFERKSKFSVRRAAQQKRLNLPRFSTTTIGSFPQTKEIRIARNKFNKSELSAEDYEKAMEAEVEKVIRFQEKIDLDLLVHGEPERNDMVQYFGEKLNGVLFSQNGWVQSYGSRCVRPPIIVSDISRPEAMTVRWSAYAQSLTSKPVKGMLTGPVTILNWSFPRVDVSREIQCKQLALALRDEVNDLEAGGIYAIQVDEPAIREGLPLRRVDWDAYLTWAVDSFRLSTSGVEDSTFIASHFCYSDFNDIFPSIQRLDADAVSIEASKSSLKLLDVFKQHNYSNVIGPGVYDIHSPRVPSQQEIQDRIAAMLELIPADLLDVNPDCGLKTRGWKETEAALVNLVQAAKWARETYPASA